MPLTDVAVRNIKPSPRIVRYRDERGLYLEVSHKGGKRWRFRYTFRGKENMLSLGVYPDVSLRDARERRDEARKLIANGMDPGKARQDEKAVAEAQAAADANPFEVVARDWHAEQVKAWSEGHAAKVLARMGPCACSPPPPWQAGASETTTIAFVSRWLKPCSTRGEQASGHTPWLRRRTLRSCASSAPLPTPVTAD
ncbi:Arm DNA-binding domain-containing protein [Solidesulfovibrio alcoholivorans]|uniref:Arm DNA-binding domain-containing protein n=1 Tax=Solidesulfovibrio alcoholivorans TaxID=81406 RepID=UPI000694C094|nr:Arm DNA-binding domain-containing protein [Solidesulfovibrio alcoholivorans]